MEIRCYKLAPGAAAEFERLVTERALPLLHRAGVDVVAYGPSLHDDHAYHLIRAYLSLAELRRSEEAVYGSKAWRHGPRQAILDCIEQYTSVVIELDETTVDGLRLGRSRPARCAGRLQREPRSIGDATSARGTPSTS